MDCDCTICLALRSYPTRNAVLTCVFAPQRRAYVPQSSGHCVDSVSVSACRLTLGLLTAGACGFGDGLADVVAGSAVAVGDPGRASGPGMGGFRCAGRSGGLRAQVAKSAAN